MAFTNCALGFDYPASAFTMMGIVGISRSGAIVGGAMFILVTVVSVFFGKPVESESSYGVRQLPLLRADRSLCPRVATQPQARWGFAAPGTFLLAMFFLAIFVLYYAVNWKYLASVWPMS